VRFSESLRGTKDHKPVKAALDTWYHEVRSASWKSSAEVKKKYRNASIVGSERIVFSIKGNDYRLVVAVDYQIQIVFIKWIGTHKQYDAIDVLKVKYADQAD
jgi:mRNA interferase HigB